MAGEHFAHRRGLGFAFGFGFAVNVALVHAQAHPQADEHQHQRGDKGNAPAPGNHLFVADGGADGEEHAVGHQKADGRAQLREGAEPGAFAFGRVFGGDQRRAAPFAAQPDALADAAQAQQQRCGDADVVIVGQEADADGGQPHGQQ